MADGVLFNIAERIIVRLGSLAFQEIGLLWGVKDELQKLKEKVAQLQAVLLDAEQKQANNEVRLWLQRVEDAVYEADDLLDEFDVEAQWRKMAPGHNKVSKQVRIFFSSSNQLAFRRKMGHKLKDINERLCVIFSNRTFHLEVNPEDTRFITRQRVTHSYVLEDNIIGRDEDKREVIQLLLDPISTENVSTISIVGFGGLGKTALAQLIFNDELVKNHFEVKMWICVSNVFELNILAKGIIQSATNKEPKNLTMDQMQKTLREKIDGKRYLLVLDDVWNEDREKWLSLKHLLMSGAKGSKILITTRSQIVATKSDTAKPYTLRGLDEKQSWTLFKKMAFEEGKLSENSTIRAAGEEIARKCVGVPLAIRTIGRMLYGEDRESKWLNFKNEKLSKIRQEENDVLPTLKLSYDVLPSHLKHCFAYCSLFPSDYEIHVDTLIRLWVAQGFVKSSNENDLEEVGHEYYKELLWRSFFQEEKVDKFGSVKSCKMHDLMNELAILVSRDKSIIIDLNRTNFDEECRHLFLNIGDDSFEWEIPTSLLKPNKIRTFRFASRQMIPYESFCSTIALNFMSLRMLSLSGLRIVELPNCLRKLKHLRYLDLSYNSIKRLPNWVAKLQNLETLDLSECKDLVELPRDIGKLINLRHLILEGCYSLSVMPRGMDELTNLRTLTRFVLGKNNSTLRRVQKLRGQLEIEVRHRKNVMPNLNDVAILKDKKHLDSLNLRWMVENTSSSAVEEDDVIMVALQPHSNLKELHVERYSGVRFASWVPSLTNIVDLKLLYCNRCEHLAALDHLPSLKILQLHHFKNLEYISDEDDRWSSIRNGKMPASSSSSSSASTTMTSTLPTPFFPSLTKLSLYDCPNLKGWWSVQSTASSVLADDVVGSSLTADLSFPLPSFPCLSELEILFCPNLTSMPLYPNVDQLRLWHTSCKVLPNMELFVAGGTSDNTHDVHVSAAFSSFSSPLSKLKSLDMLDVECVPEGIGSLISLQSLTIGQVRSLESLPEGIGNLKSLQELRIDGCSNLALLPEGIRRLTSLNHLEILYCPLLVERCRKETGDDWLKIAHIPNIEVGEECWLSTFVRGGVARI